MEDDTTLPVGLHDTQQNVEEEDVLPCLIIISEYGDHKYVARSLATVLSSSQLPTRVFIVTDTNSVYDDIAFATWRKILSNFLVETEVIVTKKGQQRATAIGRAIQRAMDLGLQYVFFMTDSFMLDTYTLEFIAAEEKRQRRGRIYPTVLKLGEYEPQPQADGKTVIARECFLQDLNNANFNPLALNNLCVHYWPPIFAEPESKGIPIHGKTDE